MTAQISGQLVEWLVWAQLVAHSSGTSHVFLPIQDRGVDGILRRPADDSMVALQVKGSHRFHGGFHAVVAEAGLDAPQVRWVLACLDPEGPALLPDAVVCDGETIRRLGTPGLTSYGTAARVVEFPVPVPAGSPWRELACPLAGMADALLPPVRASLAEVAVPLGAESPEQRAEARWMGGLAEVEVMRLLCGVPELQVFKSFPDLELTEYVVRDERTGALRGVQVKCVGLEGADDEGAFVVRKADLATPSAALIVVLGWRRDLAAFDDVALLFPAAKMAELGYEDGDRWEGLLHPRGRRGGRFDAVRVGRREVGRLVLEGLGG